MDTEDMTGETTVKTDWWQDAVIYQIYPRSFADGNGDGVGDLLGVLERLDYLESLGIDAIWLSPFYVSPQVDGGYDVADYRDVDPLFGNLCDFDRLLETAHARRMKVIVDLVPNHSSDAHTWFQEAIASPTGSAERQRYVFRNGGGVAGELPPNNWDSVFGGPAWTRLPDDQWYLHLFDSRQPDLNWRNPAVIEEFDDILRFWLDRGVDGFRVDVAHGMIKHRDLPDSEFSTGSIEDGGVRGPMWDQDEVHEIYRRWHEILSEYEDRILVAEAWVASPERLSRYVRSDEMQQAFNFGFMTVGWDAIGLRRAIDTAIASNQSVGATATWVLSNHDVVRHSSRFGLTDPTAMPNGIAADGEQPNGALGIVRARAASAIVFALPGSAYLYEGEELGLPEHTTLPSTLRQDPTYFRTGGAELGRDGCRIPMPWDSRKPGFGFSATGKTWLPQPATYASLAVDRQEGDPDSTLEFYRLGLRLRTERRLGTGAIHWNDSTASLLDFSNSGVRVIVNFGPGPIELPADAEVLLASDRRAIASGMLQANAGVWVV
jgi:alpha-glucosidase